MINYKELLNKKKPIIVQIGSNDGVLGEEYGLHELLDELNDFTLILVEPIGKFFDNLINVYGKYGDKIKYVNKAITDTNGYFNMVLDYGMSRIVEHKGDIIVEGITWSNFINELNITDIDLLLLDCEGYEFDILKQIDFKYNIIKIIRYEYYWIKDKIECDSFLSNNGFNIDYCSHDYIYNKIAFKND